jgi:hypothetical protein
MANVMYEGAEFAVHGLLVTESLYETLYRLEEARVDLRPYTSAQVHEALDWLKGRLGSEETRLTMRRTDFDRQRTGGYRAPAGDYVRARYLKLPTGEGTWNTPVQAIRLILHWEKHDTELAQRARASFLDVYPYPHAAPGRFCCGRCNAVYQPTLKLVDPERYADQEPAFIEALNRDRRGGSRWGQHPFYYTLLALDEIGTDATRDELRAMARRIGPSLLKRYSGKDDRSSRFRRLAIESTLKYV